jgi:hypothetical protein
MPIWTSFRMEDMLLFLLEVFYSLLCMHGLEQEGSKIDILNSFGLIIMFQDPGIK